MKIDFIISTLGGGGAERVLALMANSLAKNPNNKVSVLTLFGSKEEDYKLHHSINRVQLKQIKIFPSHTLSSIVNLSWHYRNSYNKPDVIVSFITLTNLISIVVAKLFSIKIIAQEHNSHLRHMNGRKKITDFTKKYVYKMANCVTVLTSFDVDFYRKYGVNVYVMPNPCSFIPITKNTHKRNNTILAIGNLNRYHHKGFDNLIELLVPIFVEYPEWNLKIAGAGDEGLEHLKTLAKKYKILDKIAFTGFIDNVSEIMYESSVFILPSRFEGLPMVLLEAMSQGMACIAYNCKTGPSDIIVDNKNGLLIQDQQMLEMQNGLRKLLSNFELRNRLSKEGIKSLNKYDISTITKRYESLFDKIVNT